MEWVSNWIQGIIVTVIICTIIEMILPEGNNKKYIKVVIGVYILFSIISPVITKITGSNFKLSNTFDLNEYIEASSKSTYNSIEKNQDAQIKEIYEASLKCDMIEKIENKGYKVTKIVLDIDNDENYTLKKITLNVNKVEKENTNKSVENVNEIKVDIKNSNNTNNNSKNEQIASKEQKELKQYLSSVYEIDEKNISIN